MVGKERAKMKSFKETNIFYLLFLIVLSSSTALSTPSFCGRFRIRTPFSIQNSTQSPALSHMLLCKSQKLYFRTSIGLFPISSIDYRAKTLTISHYSCSSSHHFISPSLLSAGFPSPPMPNSLLLFNCFNQRQFTPPFLRNCTHLYSCQSLYENQEQEQVTSSCLLVHDSEKLDINFNPKDLNCSHYNRVYRSSSSSDEGFELGTRISFDIPDHPPKICDECYKPQGNCGIGLRCICHPKMCKDKVFSIGVTLEPFGNHLLALLYFIVIVVSFMGF